MERSPLVIVILSSDETIAGQILALVTDDSDNHALVKLLVPPVSSRAGRSNCAPRRSARALIDEKQFAGDRARHDHAEAARRQPRRMIDQAEGLIVESSTMLSPLTPIGRAARRQEDSGQVRGGANTAAHDGRVSHVLVTLKLILGLCMVKRALWNKCELISPEHGV